MFLLNWLNYDIDKINIESILILLNELNSMMIVNRISIQSIHRDMNAMISTFFFNIVKLDLTNSIFLTPDFLDLIGRFFGAAVPMVFIF